MSSRDWRLFAALGIGFAVVVAAGIVTTTFLVSTYRQEHAAQRDDASSAYQSQAYEQAKLYCIDVPDSERAKCLTDQTEAAQAEKRNEYDLRAQQEMSEWALGVLILSASGFVVSSAGLLALVWTFYEQRKLGRDHARAFIEQLGATIYYRPQWGMLDVAFYLFNGGDTPALDFVGDLQITFRPRYGPNADETESFHRPLTVMGGTVLRNSVEAIRAFNWKVAPEEIKQILEPMEPVYEGKGKGWVIDRSASLDVSGVLLFQDAFGRDHIERVHYWVKSLPVGTEHVMIGSQRNFSPEAALQKKQGNKTDDDHGAASSQEAGEQPSEPGGETNGK